MHEDQASARYYVSGVVQGVGYRYFARSAALRLGVSGYVRNLRDGRVEVYATGTSSTLASLRVELARGPHSATVSGIVEEKALSDARHAGMFSIEYDE